MTKMCKWGTDTLIHVIRHGDKPDGWHPCYVDACIANYVQEMNNRGIITLDCCCSHGKGQAIVSVWPESEPLMKQYGYAYEIGVRDYLTESHEPYSETYLDHYIPGIV